MGKRSLKGGKAEEKPWQESLSRRQEPSQKWWSCEVIDDEETSLSFSINTFTEDLSRGRFVKWQVVEFNGFRNKQM